MSTTRRFPGFEHVYELHERDHKAFRATLELGSVERYSVLRGEVRPHAVGASWAMGKRVPDAIVPTTHPAPVLLSEPLVTALREAGCTGWAVYDVALKGKHGEDVGRYFGLMITGRCGAVSYGSHGRLVKRMVARGPDVPYVVGIRFDESSWDGSDLFVAPNRWSVFVTEQARDIILSFARSVAFEPLTQVAIPERYVTD